MSFMDKIKSFFSGGSNAGADEHAGHDHSAHDHSHEAAVPMPASEPTMPTSEPSSDADEDRPA